MNQDFIPQGDEFPEPGMAPREIPAWTWRDWVAVLWPVAFVAGVAWGVLV